MGLNMEQRNTYSKRANGIRSEYRRETQKQRDEGKKQQKRLSNSNEKKREGKNGEKVTLKEKRKKKKHISRENEKKQNKRGVSKKKKTNRYKRQNDKISPILSNQAVLSSHHPLVCFNYLSCPQSRLKLHAQFSTRVNSQWPLAGVREALVWSHFETTGTTGNHGMKGNNKIWLFTKGK